MGFTDLLTIVMDGYVYVLVAAIQSQTLHTLFAVEC